MKHIVWTIFILSIVACENGSKYEEKYPSGEIKLTGQLDKNGLREGVWNTYDTYGNITIKSHYRNDSLYLKEYYQKGILKSKEEIKGGLKHGKRWSYYDSGELKTEVSFSKDRKVGQGHEYYKNGSVKTKYNYDSNGVVAGSFRQYYPNGAVNVEADNYGNGTQKFYSKESELQLTLLIENHEVIDTLFKKENAIEVLGEDMKLLDLPQ